MIQLNWSKLTLAKRGNLGCMPLLLPCAKLVLVCPYDGMK